MICRPRVFNACALTISAFETPRAVSDDCLLFADQTANQCPTYAVVTQLNCYPVASEPCLSTRRVNGVSSLGG